MAEITRETVRKIARLANLNLSESEQELYAGQLEKIVEYVHKLKELDTTGVPQTTHALPLQDVWREDEVKPSLPREDALSQAPDAVDGCFRVPRIVE
ncbi:MAG: Asp-tRNA(Asn)/Glu-tRNA(Gln) amidotransferase subunit GatC [Candidatus Firestonebacteria bacterium]|nr:Asp-tRNA(Asn)/Glu-tRNA(Gln) amidotransferase subunit GatC [Candidatus Firestonebacteria bacterium]